MASPGLDCDNNDNHHDNGNDQYIRRHVNLFSVPHTVTEDLARQPTVTINKITPSSVRQFLHRPRGDITRAAVERFFNAGSSNIAAGSVATHGGGGGGVGAVGGGGGSGVSAGDPGMRPALPPDIDLLLELLEFCLSDCPPPPGDRPPGVYIGAGGVGAPESGDTEEENGGEGEEDDAEVIARNSREAQKARLVREGSHLRF